MRAPLRRGLRLASVGRPTIRIEGVMPRISAGLLPYRWQDGELEVFLVHPGGPFWARKDDGAWSIPKGEIGPDEAPIAAARREFGEETGLAVDGEVIALTPIRQAGGKLVHAFAIAADLDPAAIRSNRFTMEWPPRSGEQREFPEIDRAGWFGLEAAREKLLASQVRLLDELRERLQPEGVNRPRASVPDR
jgi:predicted NUDIX family NTP pyrophosphohydrolase